MFSYAFLLSASVLLNGRVAVAKGGTPCQIASSMSADFARLYPSATPVRIPAAEAANCLKSVPIDIEEETALIDELQLYLNWQSSLSYIQNPPESYKGEQTDIIGEIKRIRSDLVKGTYKDEYTFMLDLYMAFIKANDFHLNFNPDILDIFTFRRGNIGMGLQDEFAIVSVSTDGKELPKLYNYYDIMNSTKQGWKPSPITKINNQNAEDFVQNWSRHFDHHEDHARYNRLFPNHGYIGQGIMMNQFGLSKFFNDDYTNVEYENGTKTELLNTAKMAFNALDNVKSGEDLFDKFCNIGPPIARRDNSLSARVLSDKKKRSLLFRDSTWEEETAKAKRADVMKKANGYPDPEIFHSSAAVGGYYLKGEGYEDVAILTVPTFEPKGVDGVEEFQDIIGKFLKDAKADGKKKLVIDLRGNGGGYLWLGYDLFKQLFPSKDPYGASRFRANEAFNVVGRIVSETLKNHTYGQALADFALQGQSSKLATAWKLIFNYKLPLTINNEPFTSWDDYFGPNEFNGDNFTDLHRFDLNNPFTDDLTMDVTGYAGRMFKLNKDQAFEAENMVLLQDGLCGSTCAIFNEFMKFQGGVQQVVVGGKPETGPMQGVAGSKGAQVYTFETVHKIASQALDQIKDNTEAVKKVNATEMGRLIKAQRPLYRSSWSSSGAVNSRINLRDNIRMNDTTQTPLEFVYEAADCRIFYTGDMVRDPAEVWKKAVDGRWKDSAAVCVEGSIAHSSSISGGAPTEGSLGRGNGAASEKAKSVFSSAPSTPRGLGAMTAVAVGAVALFVMF